MACSLLLLFFSLPQIICDACWIRRFGVFVCVLVLDSYCFDEFASELITFDFNVCAFVQSRQTFAYHNMYLIQIIFLCFKSHSTAAIISNVATKPKKTEHQKEKINHLFSCVVCIGDIVWAFLNVRSACHISGSLSLTANCPHSIAHMYMWIYFWTSYINQWLFSSFSCFVSQHKFAQWASDPSKGNTHTVCVCVCAFASFEFSKYRIIFFQHSKYAHAYTFGLGWFVFCVNSYRKLISHSCLLAASFPQEWFISVIVDCDFTHLFFAFILVLWPLCSLADFRSVFLFCCNHLPTNMRRKKVMKIWYWQ